MTADHVLVDGHERWRAIQELGITKFPMRIVVGCMTEAERVRLAIKLNLEHRQLTVAQRRELATPLFFGADQSYESQRTNKPSLLQKDLEPKGADTDL